MGRHYYKIVEVTDLGPYVTKLVLPVEEIIKADVLKPEMFNVYVERKDKNGTILNLPKSFTEKKIVVPSKGYCEVQDVYPSCEEGNRREEARFITLEIKSTPFGLSSEIAARNGMNEFIISDYRITQLKEIEVEGKTLSGMVFDQCAGSSMKQADKFLHGVSNDSKLPLKYGYFIPQTGNGQRPLIIWLHGAGEGGQDPTIAYVGNKVVNLASEEIQAKFGGAFILVPQAPTFWMDDGSGRYGRTGRSMYVQALKALIDEFIERNDTAIDKNRIYIGGCSNGGFMTMRMILDYPDFFAAAFPVCEALYDELIEDQHIEAIKHIPIWFTHAKHDPVVKPEETTIPTYKRLIQAGAKHVHFTYFEQVIDLYSVFTDEEGKPFKYPSHFSWIYVLNDDCHLDYDGKPVVMNGEKVTLMNWLAMQRKPALEVL